ncbi:MAG: putative MaoC-like dehydratase [Caulobacter sp.]|nr:putative MaoC-like dehydratase [Caulobacter sp.]
MPLNYDVMMNWPHEEQRQRYSKNQTILYALGVGANLIDDAADANLPYVWEEQLVAVPTMAAVLALEPFWISDPRTGVTWSQMLHGEQSMVWHSPLPASGEVIGLTVVEEIFDKGEGRGAIMVLRQELRSAADDTPIVTNRARVFLRADGGFGGRSDAPAPHVLPDRAPDFVDEQTTRPEQALIYRLSGDWIPLHVDPAFARNAGFKGPILHGMATFGFACLGVLRHVCGDEPARLKQLDARFSSPVYPGERIRTEIWREGPGEAGFRCLVEGRVVLNNGYARYDPG